ncbi:MAG: hypothetical protein HKN18_11485 [Silicimonas sp.]|nr:hypothetical protein [Silicimonas sp.]
MSVQGGTESGGQIAAGTANAIQSPRGLSVQSADDSPYEDGTWQIDSYGANDAVIFQFDRAVRLESITFAMGDWWDRFGLYLGDDLTYQRDFKVDDLSGFDWVSTILLDAGYLGTRFAIGASEYQACGYSIVQGHGCWSENSAFRITGITFSDVSLEAVPLPPAGAALGAGILALGWMSRRRRAQSVNIEGSEL